MRQRAASLRISNDVVQILGHYAMPMVDIFAKAGVARLQSSVESSINCIADCPTKLVPSSFSLDQKQTRVAYGAGAQIMVAAVAIRAEYERISATGGDPDLLSLGISWSF